MTEYCDLNVMETSSFATNLSNIKQLISLGYTKIAINREYAEIEKDSKKKSAAKEIQTMKQLLSRLHQELVKITHEADNDFVIPKKFQLLSRVTLPMFSTDEIQYLRTTYYKDLCQVFDIIAIRPGNEKVMKILTEGKIEYDIIALAMENKMSFKLTKPMMTMCIAKGFVFEIGYSSAIKSTSLRKYIFNNGQQLVHKTKNGVGIIISSAGDHRMDFRAPLDVINLASLFHLKGSACKDAISKSCLKILSHSRIRKDTFKGALSVEKIDEPNTDENESATKRMKFI